MVPGAGAGVDDPHTERKVSKRPFSTCRRSRPTPEAKHATRTRADLCSRVPLDCTPAITIDLADAHEHDERAELDQEHHDEADHNAQAPSPASSKHWSLWSTLLFRTHLQHAAGVRRTHDQQMQQRGGRRRSVTQHGRLSSIQVRMLYVDQVRPPAARRPLMSGCSKPSPKQHDRGPTW